MGCGGGRGGRGGPRVEGGGGEGILECGGHEFSAAIANGRETSPLMELHIPDLPPTEVDQHFSWTCFMIYSEARVWFLANKSSKQRWRARRA